MGKLRRTHILDQAGDIATLIQVPLDTIRIDAFGVLTTPEQMDKLLMLAKKKTHPAKQRHNALQS